MGPMVMKLAAMYFSRKMVRVCPPPGVYVRAESMTSETSHPWK